MRARSEVIVNHKRHQLPDQPAHLDQVQQGKMLCKPFHEAEAEAGRSVVGLAPRVHHGDLSERRSGVHRSGSAAAQLRYYMATSANILFGNNWRLDVGRIER